MPVRTRRGGDILQRHLHATCGALLVEPEVHGVRIRRGHCRLDAFRQLVRLRLYVGGRTRQQRPDDDAEDEWNVGLCITVY